jgi:hypothetical protein
VRGEWHAKLGEKAAMKIVKWDEFKTLPTGTVFQEYSLHDLGSLSVLGSVIEDIDFVSADLLPACFTDGNYSGKITDPFVISHPSGFGRDGFFDLEKRTWLVWDEDDRKRLAAWLLGDAAKDQNDDDMIYPVPLVFVEASQ